MTTLVVIAAASAPATALLTIQVAHRRWTRTARAGDTWDIALFASAWSWTAALASIAGRLVFEHVLPAPLAADFDSAAASTTAALVAAIACGSSTWTALIISQASLAAYHHADAQGADHDERKHAAARAVLPQPPITTTHEEKKRADEARIHALGILLGGGLLGALTGAAATLAVATAETALQQTLAAIGRHAAVISGALSAALWLRLGSQAKTNDGDDDGTPQSPSPTA